jgi:hypothetical protein
LDAGAHSVGRRDNDVVARWIGASFDRDFFEEEHRTRSELSMIVLRAILLGSVAVAAQSGLASQLLVPGVLSLECRSALRIGVIACDDHTDSNQAASVGEMQVNEFLANYGKPPREAVRALLDPSYSNISAWLRKQREVVAIASYVASRMTELGAHIEGNPTTTPPMLASHLPATMQMRATLFFKLQDPASLQAIRALQGVVSRYPSIAGRLEQIGPPPASQRGTWLAALNTVMPISIASPDTTDNISLPSLLIEDLRYKTSLQVDATGLTAKEICDRIVALRTTAEIGRRHFERMSPIP